MNTKTLLIYLFALFTFYFSLFPCFGQNEPRLVLPVGHTGIVYSAEFSPDGQRIVTASRDNTAKVWDASTGKLLYSLEGHTWDVNSAVFSPDGQRIVTASDDNTAKVWETESGKLLYSLEGHTDNVHSAVFSPDGQRIVTVSDDAIVIVWNASSGKLLYSLEGQGNLYSAVFSSDGQRIVTASRDSTATVWDAISGEFLFSLEGHTNYVRSAVFSPDGNWILTASLDNTAKVWDAISGKLLVSLEGHVTSAVFSPVGQRIVTASDDNTAKVWETESGKLVYSLEGHDHWVISAVFSPDGQRIVTTSEDNTAKVWDAETGKLLLSLEGHTDGVNSAQFSPDGQRIATASRDNTAKIWDAISGKLLLSLEGHTYGVTSAVFSPDGNWILTASLDNTAKVWDAKKGKLVSSIEGHSVYVRSALFSPDGQKIVTASDDNTAKVWETESGKLVYSLEGHDHWVLSAVFSPDGQRIVTTSSDETAKVWDAISGKLLFSLDGPKYDVNSAEFSPDGQRIVTACDDRTAKVWDALRGKLLYSLKGHTQWVNSVVFSPDGNWILTASDDNTAKVWDAKKGKLLYSLEGHTRSINLAVFSPDGQRIVTVSEDAIVIVWDAISGEPLYIRHSAYVPSAVFSPDGQRIVTASVDAKVWDASSGKLLQDINLNGGVCYEVNLEKNQLISYRNSMLTIWDMETGKEIYSWVAVDSIDWIVTHPSGLFDATPGAMDKLYYVQGLEIIDFNQLKDRFWEPGLWKKVMNGEELRDVQGFDKALPLFPKVENLAINHGKIEFKLVDNGGGIGKYMIYVNDKEVYVGNQEGNEKIKDGRLMVTYKLEGNQYLKPGNENQIKVKAYNAENYIVSRGATLQYKHKEEKRINPSIFIVSCGVSDYTGDAIDLRYAAKDAEDIHHSLHIGAEKLFGEDKTFQYLLTTNKEKEKWPTKENIKSTFKEIAAKAKSTDVIVLYLSGHGINWGGQDGDFYYLTQDAYTASGEAYNDPAIREKSTLSSNELVELFKLVPATKQVLIIDACASGQVVEDLIAQRDISSSTIRALDRMKDRTGMFIITGSAADAVSYEASKYGQGLLTYSLLEGIKGAALREGQFIDIDLLFQRAKDRVPELAEGIGGIQQPQVFFPYGSASFDIGLLEEEDKTKIPLAKEKPVFVMSTFINADTYADELKLEFLVDEKLRNISAKGSDAELIFYDAKSFPEAYQLKGLYTLSGDEVDLKFNLFLGSEKLHSIEVRGSKTSMEDFVNEIIEKVNEKLD
jgi:WD40 repeat protein